jgi:hypothetical protein
VARTFAPGVEGAVIAHLAGGVSREVRERNGDRQWLR